MVHIAIGPAPGSQTMRGIAKGWIAIGDVAFGAAAFGGVAIGGLSLGGLSLGALAIGGASVGIWSIGGVAIALFAFGGAALGLIAATGGLAIAIEYAIGARRSRHMQTMRLRVTTSRQATSFATRILSGHTSNG
jgi:hypothetical protein